LRLAESFEPDMRKFLALGIFVLLAQLINAQVEQVTPLQFNPALYFSRPQTQTHTRPGNNNTAKYLVDSGYTVVTTDTLQLPFIDDFSTDRTPNYLWRQQHITATYQNVISGCLLTEGFNVVQGAFINSSSWTYTWDFTNQVVDSVRQEPVRFTFFGSGTSDCFSGTPSTLFMWPAYYRYTGFDSTTGYPIDSVVVGFPDTITYAPLVNFATGQPGTLWFDDYAYINNTFPVNPPTIGVATLDGLNQYGLPYNNSSPGNYGTADYLTSNPINISSYIESDSLYLSFFFEAQGNGDYPDVDDSLILEFKDDAGFWNVMWFDTGYSQQSYVPDTFAQVLIEVPTISASGNLYFASNFKTFQFRFRNKASLSGNNNHWNIDYVKLDANRSSVDTTIHDIAFVYPFPTILKNYTRESSSQFQYPADLSDSVPLLIHNLDPIAYTNPPATSFFKGAVEVYPSQATVGGLSVSFNAGPYNAEEIIPSLEYHIPSTAVDSLVLVSTSCISYLAANDAIVSNDTIRRTQTFGSVMAYDDGSAERSYGLVGSGSELLQFAYEFNLNKPDTLTAFQVMFAQVDEYNVSDLVFSFEAWDSLQLKNYTFVATPIYSLVNQVPLYIDSTNGFATFVLDTPLLIPKHFYFGWSQTDNRRLEIGYDVNSTLGFPHMFVNTGDYWDSTLATVQGSPMIRLILDSAYWGTTSYPLGVINLNKENTDNLNVYPNPSSGILNVSTTNNAPNLQVSIQNAIGEQVMYLPAVNNQIDISQLANGLYMLNAADPQTGKIYHTKVVKVAP
jgi:hypothetical protein